MDCRKAEYLITQRLDELLSKEEDAALAQHLACCDACACELALQERLSTALREMGREEIKAPAELSSLIINSLGPQRRSALVRLPVAWRKAVAAAATLLLLAGGSAGVMTGLNMANNNEKTIVMESPGPNVAINNGGAYAPPNNTEGGKNASPPVETPAPDGTDKTGGTQAGNPSPNILDHQQTGDINNGGEGVTPAATPTGSKTGALAAGGEKVFLSDGMKVSSTVLKIAVDDLASARTRAASMAAGVGASAQVFPEQTGGKAVLVMRLTVASDQATNLIAELSGLGTPFHRQDENRDLTPLYNETRVQYNEILERRAAATDSSEQRQLEIQAASYKQLLDAWEAEAGKQVVNLWLENN